MKFAALSIKRGELVNAPPRLPNNGTAQLIAGDRNVSSVKCRGRLKLPLVAAISASIRRQQLQSDDAGNNQSDADQCRDSLHSIPAGR